MPKIDYNKCKKCGKLMAVNREFKKCKKCYNKKYKTLRFLDSFKDFSKQKKVPPKINNLDSFIGINTKMMNKHNNLNDFSVKQKRLIQ